MTITIIDDSDFKKNVPMPASIDTSRLAALINLTQVTNIRDLLGDSLYQYVLKFLEDGEPEDSPVMEIINELRLLHCMYTAIAVYSIYYKDDDEKVKDFNISYIKGAADNLSRMVIKLIQTNETLLKVAQVSTDNQFDSDKANYNVIYYDEY